MKIKNLKLMIMFLWLLLASCNHSFKLDKSRIEIINLGGKSNFKFVGLEQVYFFHIHTKERVFPFSLATEFIPYPINLALAYLNEGDSVMLRAKLDEIELNNLNEIFQGVYKFQNHKVEFTLVRKSKNVEEIAADVALGATSKEEAYQSFFNSIEKRETSEGETLGRGVVKFLIHKGTKESVVYGSYYLIKYKMYHLTNQVKLLEETPENGIIVQVGNEALIEGLSESLNSMKVGEKARFYIPYYLAFGTKSSEWLPAYANLLIELEVIQKVSIEG